jgi:hypothetical protein
VTYVQRDFETNLRYIMNISILFIMNTIIMIMIISILVNSNMITFISRHSHCFHKLKLFHQNKQVAFDGPWLNQRRHLNQRFRNATALTRYAIGSKGLMDCIHRRSPVLTSHTLMNQSRDEQEK